MSKNFFQDIHYNRSKANFALACALLVGEFFYKKIIQIKNFLYEKEVLKEKQVSAKVICAGNLTTGGVGKTPIVIELANNLSKEAPTAVISRGYGAKISNKNPNIIKDFDGLKYQDGTLCADEPFQIAKKTSNNVVVITCADRYKAANLAVEKYKIKNIILDDGFSNRKLKKDKTYIVIDSKMRFGNNHLLPKGPLREPLEELKRADEIIIVDKNDENLNDAILWAQNFKKPLSVCKMTPKKIYNAQTKAQVLLNDKTQKAIAFCAIGQPSQFFDFAKQYYILKDAISFDDHHKYNKNDIKKLIKIAQKNKVNTFITTQKDETKLFDIIKDISHYSFNVLELKTIIEKI